MLGVGTTIFTGTVPWKAPIVALMARRTTPSTTATIVTVFLTAIIVRDIRAPGDMVCLLTPYLARAQDGRTPAAHPLQGGQGCRSNQPLIPLEPHVQYGHDGRARNYR